MEHGIQISNNYNFQRFIGYNHTAGDNPDLVYLFSDESLRLMSTEITKLLKGVDDEGRDIVVPDNRISEVLTTVYNDYRPPTGDIHSRYIVTPEYKPNYIKDIMNETIQIIVQTIKNSLTMEYQNKKLTVWSSVLGDFNKEGLMPHSKIRLREKHPTRMQFHMRY